MWWGWGSVGRGIGKSACSSLLRCSAFSTWKKQRGLPWQQIPNQHRVHTPLFHTPYHPCSRLLLLLLLLPSSSSSSHPPPPPPIPVVPLLPGHLSADRELRPQTGLLMGAGIRLRPGIMSKAPLSIPEQEHVPADTGAQQTVFPLFLPLHLYSIAAIYFVLKPLRR